MGIQSVMNWVTLILLSTYLLLTWRLVETKRNNEDIQKMNRDQRNVHWTRLRQMVLPANRLKRSLSPSMKRSQTAQNNPYWRMTFKRQTDPLWTRLKRNGTNNWIRISKYPFRGY